MAYPSLSCSLQRSYPPERSLESTEHVLSLDTAPARSQSSRQSVAADAPVSSGSAAARENGQNGTGLMHNGRPSDDGSLAGVEGTLWRSTEYLMRVTEGEVRSRIRRSTDLLLERPLWAVVEGRLPGNTSSWQQWRQATGTSDGQGQETAEITRNVGLTLVCSLSFRAGLG